MVTDDRRGRRGAFFGGKTTDAVRLTWKLKIGTRFGAPSSDKTTSVALRVALRVALDVPVLYCSTVIAAWRCCVRPTVPKHKLSVHVFHFFRTDNHVSRRGQLICTQRPYWSTPSTDFAVSLFCCFVVLLPIPPPPTASELLPLGNCNSLNELNSL